LNQWVYGWASEEDKKEIEKIIPVGNDGFIIATKLQGLHKYQMNLDKDEFNEIKKQAAWWMRQQLLKPYHTLSFFSQILPETMITVVTCEEKIKDKQCYFRSRNLTEVLKHFPAGMDKKELKITIGIGEPSGDMLLQIEQCYKSAVTVLQYGFYFPGTQVLRASYILPRRVKQISVSLAEEGLIKDALREGAAKKAEASFEAILERCTNNGYPEPGHLKTCCENMLRNAALAVQSGLVWQAREGEGAEDNYETLLDGGKAFLRAVTEEIKLKKAGKNIGFAEKFQEYLNENYLNDISLYEIAEYFHLTPAYFSTLVKEVTGTSFLKSLIQVRIGKAKHMLRETDTKIYKIAKETGYNDVKYFNRVFKKEIGITPIQYREELKGIKEERDGLHQELLQ